MTLAILLIGLDITNNLDLVTGVLSIVIWVGHLMYHENKRIVK